MSWNPLTRHTFNRVLKSFNEVRPNSLCKPLIGQTFHRVDHVSWSNYCNLHWVHFIDAVVKICWCHPHSSFTFSLGGFLSNHIWCYVCDFLHVTWFGCMRSMCDWSFMGTHLNYWFMPPLPPQEVFLSYCNFKNSWEISNWSKEITYYFYKDHI